MIGFGAEQLYFGLQSLRTGLTRDMVRRAGDLLDSSWPTVREYVLEQLARNYGVEGVPADEWLAQQPVVGKTEIRQQSHDSPSLLSRIKSERRHTSGSTGRPLDFRRSRRMTAWMDATMWAVYGWHGIKPGDRMARFWGRPLTGMETRLRDVADRLLQQRRMSAFEVTAERCLDFFRELLHWKPRFAYGYPTLLSEFVEHLRRSGEDGRQLQLHVVITTGELLDQATRRSLREFFGCPVVNEYGCSESGIVAFECTEGVMHLTPVASVAEVDACGLEIETPVQGPVQVTDLYGDVMPFVRYSLEDVAELNPPAECGCGRELPQMEILAGRVDGFIRTPSGRSVYDAVLAYTVPEGVVHFQVKQVALDTIVGELVVGQEYDESEVLELCRSRWRAGIGADIKVVLTAVEEIARDGTGKFRYFIPIDEAAADESA